MCCNSQFRPCPRCKNTNNQILYTCKICEQKHHHVKCLKCGEEFNQECK